MPRPAQSNGAETRERILEVAQELFIAQGYDKTSLRDIAERLGITKAALYYYFARKDDILLELHMQLHELGSTMIAALEAAPDGPERIAVWSQLIDDMIDFMAANRELILMHFRNESALAALARSEANQNANADFDARFSQVLSSPAIPLRDRLRMAATLGIVTEILAENAPAFDDVPPEELAGLVRELVAEMAPGAGPSERPGSPPASPGSRRAAAR